MKDAPAPGGHFGMNFIELRRLLTEFGGVW
jgi:hypothetical protein